MQINGVAAGLEGAKVEARCAVGNGNTTSGPNGAYTLVVEGGRLPCVVRAGGNGNTLHSLATSTAAQITMATELVVASLAGGKTPAAYYESFDFAAASALTPIAANDAMLATTTMLSDAGLRTDGVGDLLTAPLQASASPADPYSQLLMALKGNLLATRTALSDATAALARAAGGSTTAATGPTQSLPPAQLLAADAPGCTALRSGRYRYLVFQNDTPGTNADTDVVTIDAPALKLTTSAGQALALTAAGACRFVVGGGRDAPTFAVSSSGVILAVVKNNANNDSLESGSMRGALLFPEQRHALAELNGEWNAIGLQNNLRFHAGPNTGYGTGSASITTFDATGHVKARTDCDIEFKQMACQALGDDSLPAFLLAPRGDGGFDWRASSDGQPARLYAYRSGTGDLMLVAVGVSVHIQFYTRKAALALPRIGTARAGWTTGVHSYLVSNFTGSDVSAGNQARSWTGTVNSVDEPTGRINSSVNVPATTGSQPDFYVINKPLAGYMQELAAYDFSESGIFRLPLKGMGLDVVAANYWMNLWATTSEAAAP